MRSNMEVEILDPSQAHFPVALCLPGRVSENFMSVCPSVHHALLLISVRGWMNTHSLRSLACLLVGQQLFTLTRSVCLSGRFVDSASRRYPHTTGRGLTEHMNIKASSLKRRLASCPAQGSSLEIFLQRRNVCKLIVSTNAW